MNQPNTPQTTQPILDSQEKVWECSPFVAKYCQQGNYSFNNILMNCDLLTDHLDHKVRLAAQLADVDEENQKRLAYSMGYSTWLEFLKELQHHKQNVQAIIP